VTPVLIWADLPIAIRVTDEERPPHTAPRAYARGRYRCQARSRGDTYLAANAGVPAAGGYRCQYTATNGGLCGRHFRHATPAVRRRALELAQESDT
jgi:hypothetical protein